MGWLFSSYSRSAALCSSWDGWDFQIKSDLNDYDIILERRLMLPGKLKYRKRKDYEEWWKQRTSGKISYFFLAASTHCDTFFCCFFFFLDRLLFCWVLFGFSFPLLLNYILISYYKRSPAKDLPWTPAKDLPWTFFLESTEWWLQESTYLDNYWLQF